MVAYCKRVIMGIHKILNKPYATVLMHLDIKPGTAATLGECVWLPFLIASIKVLRHPVSLTRAKESPPYNLLHAWSFAHNAPSDTKAFLACITVVELKELVLPPKHLVHNKVKFLDFLRANIPSRIHVAQDLLKNS
uniref:Uncharacterized protein n=1 Tax=Arundo donax TaxID=35708 RepID=A0A0A9CZE0_ARUDO